MKKLIVLGIMFLGIVAMAEKLTTDGKNNLDKLKGTWGGAMYSVELKNNKWLLGSYDAEGTIWEEIQLYKNGALVIKDFYKMPNRKDKNFYFAWDSKYKIFVELDKDLNIIDKVPRKLNHPYN